MIPVQECTALTTDRLAEILHLPAKAAEHVLHGRLVYLDTVDRLSFMERALICYHVEANPGIHESLPHPLTGEPCTFGQWMKLCSPGSWEHCYAALRAFKELSDITNENGIPVADLVQIPQCNVETLKLLSTGVRNDPEVLEAAKVPDSKAFDEHVHRTHPEQHFEPRTPLRFSPEDSARAVIEKALAEAMKRGAHSRTEALELISVEALESWSYEDEVSQIPAEQVEWAMEEEQ